MRGRQMGVLVVLGLCAVGTSGCIEYHIESRNYSMILARGKGTQVRSLAEIGHTPLVEQRQFGFVSGLIFLSEHKFSHAVQGAPLTGVGIVTGKHATDILVSVLTRLHPAGAVVSIFTSHTVRVYADVE